MNESGKLDPYKKNYILEKEQMIQRNEYKCPSSRFATAFIMSVAIARDMLIPKKANIELSISNSSQLAKTGLFSLKEYPLTKLQSSLLKGFIGFRK